MDGQETSVQKPQYIQGSLFEEDYLVRTLGEIAQKPDVALTELVANAWDAGASSVSITIPEDRGGMLVVEDDGTGLTEEEFKERWMKLGYNRLRHQGPIVLFPKINDFTRYAYGRNGVGRHGLLCFNSWYTVKTTKAGIASTFKVSTRNGNDPFVLESESYKRGSGHGTRLEVLAELRLPDPERMLQIISSRFLHDPNFQIKINGRSLTLEDNSGFINKTRIPVSESISIELFAFDRNDSSHRYNHQGVAFWQSGRLVGEPSWTLGNATVVDGRTRFAKRYSFVASSDDLGNFINKDWTGFLPGDEMDSVFLAVYDNVMEIFRGIAKEQISETKSMIKQDFQKEIDELSLLGKHEINEVIEQVVDSHPMTNSESINIAVSAIIHLEKTRSGKELLQKISKLSDEDIAGLNHMLEQWSIKDALSVLDEIDRRITIIEAIEKLSGEPTVDELHTLHPLITESRWLFGPEFDSSEYTSNSQLQTIAKNVFGSQKTEGLFINPLKRPDLMVFAEKSITVNATEQFNPETNLIEFGRILIVELKKGGSNLNRANREQLVGYIEDFIGCKELIGTPLIYAYLVGDSINDKMTHSHKIGETAFLNITTFKQLVDTARRRLFRLREKLSDRYDSMGAEQLIKKTEQLRLDFTTPQG